MTILIKYLAMLESFGIDHRGIPQILTQLRRHPFHLHCIQGIPQLLILTAALLEIPRHVALFQNQLWIIMIFGQVTGEDLFRVVNSVEI